MKKKRLTKTALLAIKGSTELWAKICDRLDLKPASLPTILQRNGTNLNRYDIVELIAEHMGIDPADAVEEYDSVAAVA